MKNNQWMTVQSVGIMLSLFLVTMLFLVGCVKNENLKTNVIDVATMELTETNIVKIINENKLIEKPENIKVLITDQVDKNLKPVKNIIITYKNDSVFVNESAETALKLFETFFKNPNVDIVLFSVETKNTAEQYQECFRVSMKKDNAILIQNWDNLKIKIFNDPNELKNIAYDYWVHPQLKN